MTKRKNSSKNAQVLLEHIVKNIPQYVFWKDVNSVYLGCNENYARLLDLESPEDIVGRTDLDLGWQADGDSPDLFREGDRETIAGKYITNQEEWLSLPNGTKILVLVNKAPIFDDNGIVLGVLGFATDITEKKRTEKELQEAQYKLAGMLTAGASIAHELRTPLLNLQSSFNGIKRYLPSFMKSYELAKEAGLKVDYINKGHFKSLALILEEADDEMQYSRTIIDMLLMNANQDKDFKNLSLEKSSIQQCIGNTLKRYPFSSPDQISLIHCDESDDFQFMGHELLISHVLFNLIKNSLNFIGGVKNGKIYISIKKGKTYNYLHFKDTGKGVPKENLPKLFTRFFTTTLNGTGLGLAFCKVVMEGFGGKIECDSEEGVYTQFTLSFPKLPKA